jgi:hypothetical protein
MTRIMTEGEFRDLMRVTASDGCERRIDKKETTMATSHDWARDLQRTAEFLLSRVEVEIGDRTPMTCGWFFANKEPFLALVRATRPGKKTMTEYYVNFHPLGANLELSVNRDEVCRKVQDVKWECEPLLSSAEDVEMEAEAQGHES